MNTGPYVRVYNSIIEDERFKGIYPDDRHLATWLRLLILADSMFPAPAPLPRSARAASVKALVEAGIIEFTDRDHYRVHGLAAERGRRSEAASASASARWSERNANALPTQSERNAERNANDMLAEPSLAEPSLAVAEQVAASTPDDARVAYFQLTGRFPQGRLGQWIDEDAEKYGTPALVAALVDAFKESPNLKNLMGRASDKCAIEARRLDREEREAERERIREKRATPPPIASDKQRLLYLDGKWQVVDIGDTEPEAAA